MAPLSAQSCEAAGCELFTEFDEAGQNEGGAVSRGLVEVAPSLAEPGPDSANGAFPLRRRGMRPFEVGFSLGEWPARFDGRDSRGEERLAAALARKLRQEGDVVRDRLAVL